MDAAVYAKMLSDQSIIDLKKLKYKYPGTDLKELVELLKVSVYKALPIHDFLGNGLVYMENITQVRMNAVKLLLAPQRASETFGIKAMEDEIAATLTIENIDFLRDSVRKILHGYAPSDESENRIYGMKKGLEFISARENTISEDNVHTLYDLAIGQYLTENDRLEPGMFYRHDSVCIVGREVEHTGLPYKKLPEYMGRLISFINSESIMNDLLKAATLHFYIAYLHPYFDGNGRMARLMQLWYLWRQGYSSALFIPFSSYIERSRREYYNAYTLTEDNAKISGVMDVTPFLVYFIENVYNKLENALPPLNSTETFRQILDEGKITEKEKNLWNFVLSAYGDDEFSTKQLERDFRNAAYATIRSFVLKFEEFGLLTAQKYGNKVKYSVRGK
jgi:Fic family protein